MKLIHFITIFIILFDSVENKKLQKSFEEIFGDGWHLKGMGEEGEEKEKEANLGEEKEEEADLGEEKEEEADLGEEKEEEADLGEEKEEEAKLAQIMGQENDQQQKRSGEDQSNQHQMINVTDQNKEDENDQQKRKIIHKFREIKEKIKQRKGKQSGKKWKKIETLLAKKLGTNRTYVYRWIRELGIGQRKMRKIYSEAQKSKIVQEFRTIKERIKQNRLKYSLKRWVKMEVLLAQKLGPNRDTIYKWIRELGMSQKWTNEGKLAIIRKYWEMKRNDPKMSDRKIAKALRIDRKNIYMWKGQFKELEPIMEKVVVTDEQKRKIVWVFRAIKEQMKQKGRKYSHKQWVEMDHLLAKKLGTNRRYVYKWSREFGMSQKTTQTNEEKLGIMRQYWAMKRKDPKMSDTKIAEALQVDRGSIRRWKAQFGEEE